MSDVKHTDAHDLALFETLPIDAKLREIWLNGRETNGHVADAVRDIAALEIVVTTTNDDHDGRLTKIEHREIRRQAVTAAILIAAPFVFFGLDWVKEWLK